MNNSLEFEILGHRVKFNPTDSEGVDPKLVVEEVKNVINTISNSSYKLDPSKIAILAALKLGLEKAKLEVELKEHINKLQASATDALRLIEEVTPATI